MTSMEFHGISICIPTDGRPVDPRWALSLTAIGLPVGMSVAWGLSKGDNRAANREKMVEQALAAGAAFIFFMDDDTVCPSFGLQYLFYALNQEPKAMIAAGIYCTKEDIPSPIVFDKIGGGPLWDWKVAVPPDPRAYMRVDGVGAGCMLIRASVFAHLPRPWFHEPDVTFIDNVVEIGGSPAMVARESGTDDLYFCKKVLDAGFDVLAHRSVLPAHIGQDGKVYTLPVDSYPCRPESAVVGE